MLEQPLIAALNHVIARAPWAAEMAPHEGVAIHDPPAEAPVED